MAETERIPPHNREAEISVLGAAMLDKDAMYDVLEKVKAGDFYDPNHKEIFEAIVSLQKKNSPVDVLTVCEELKKRNVLEMVGGRGYVASLSAAVPTTANAGEYARIVSEKSEARQLISTANELLEKGYSDSIETGKLLDFAEQQIFDIAQGRQNKNVVQLKDILLENLNEISERAKNKGNLTGVPTGFIDLDNMTSGMQKSDLIILAARPSMGKTAFALCVARNAAIKGSKVIVFSLEMSSNQLSQRLIAMEAGVDAQKLRNGDLDSKDWNKITSTLDRLGEADISIDDTPGLSMLEIKNKCRRLKAEKGLDLVVIDYLQLMDYEGKADSRQQEISSLSRGLKQLAREINCPVLVLSQLSRAVETRTDHRPILSDLRESGAIEQDADVVIFLYRDEFYHPDDTEAPGECEVIVAKQRNGPTGKIDVLWQSAFTKFVNKSFGR
ncbi:MAG: replicative DNA helicase [Anaerovoracaceae bacterium]|jgi:replicative DNA helicase